MFALSANQMKKLDAYAINEYKIPAVLLMEHAALAMFKEIEKTFDKDVKIVIVCGGGNNGGDGLALARILIKEGYYNLSVCMMSKKLSELSQLHYDILNKTAFSLISELYSYEEVDEFAETLDSAELIIDAIFGVSLDREVKGHYEAMIMGINMASSLGARIWSVDVPSGIDSTTGTVMGVAVKADKTFSFAYPKLGLYLFPAPRYTGEIVVADIGIPSVAIYDLMDDEDFGNVLSIIDEKNTVLVSRRANSHKGSYGTACVVAGSKGMAGALMLASKAAYHTGVGIVRALSHKENKIAFNTFLPEAIYYSYVCDGEGGSSELKEDFFEDLSAKFVDFVKKSTSLLIGCGLSTGVVSKALLELALDTDKKLIIDADGLNILAENKHLLEKVKTRQALTVLTPHLGEMSRLSGLSVKEIEENQIDVARNFAKKYVVTLVLKSARTVVASPSGETFINIKGNNGMATGGSGDVLAGIITGFLANEANDEDIAVRTGVYVHALAGDRAADKKGKRAMLARDIIDEMAGVL